MGEKKKRIIHPVIFSTAFLSWCPAIVSPSPEDRKKLSGLLHFHKDLILLCQECFGRDGIPHLWHFTNAYEKVLMFQQLLQSTLYSVWHFFHQDLCSIDQISTKWTRLSYIPQLHKLVIKCIMDCVFSTSVQKITITQCPLGRGPNFSSEPRGKSVSKADSLTASQPI